MMSKQLLICKWALLLTTKAISRICTSMSWSQVSRIFLKFRPILTNTAKISSSLQEVTCFEATKTKTVTTFSNYKMSKLTQQVSRRTILSKIWCSQVLFWAPPQLGNRRSCPSKRLQVNTEASLITCLCRTVTSKIIKNSNSVANFCLNMALKNKRQVVSHHPARRCQMAQDLIPQQLDRLFKLVQLR